MWTQPGEMVSRTVPKVGTAPQLAQSASCGADTNATNSTTSTPRTSLLPSSSLHPSQSIWSHSISAPQLPVKPPLPRPCSAQSLPTQPGTPGSTRNLGAFLPVSSLSAFPERTRSLSGSMLSSALSPVEVSEGGSPGSLPFATLDAERLRALSEASEECFVSSDSLKNAVAKIEAIYSEALQRSNAAKEAALKAQKEAESRVEELEALLLQERRERQKEKEARQEAQASQSASSLRLLDLPPTARERHHVDDSRSNSAATSLTTSLVSSDQSAGPQPKGSQGSQRSQCSLAASDSADRGSPKCIEEDKD